jgi:PleD family two-component response regulator
MIDDEAMVIAASLTPTLVLADLATPRCDGFGVLAPLARRGRESVH